VDHDEMIEGWSLRTSLLVLVAVTLAGTIALAWALLRADAKVTQSRDRAGALDEIALFAPLTNVLRERIATQLEILDVAAGDVVVYQGEYGDSFYAVEAGTLEVSVDGRQVRSLGAGDFFGEIALLADSPRTATVRAATDCRLWVLPRRAFLSVLTGSAATSQVITAASSVRQAAMPVAANERDDALSRVSLFAHLARDTVCSHSRMWCRWWRRPPSLDAMSRGVCCWRCRV
jgi:Cyclic nucleotide-binding domain